MKSRYNKTTFVLSANTVRCSIVLDSDRTLVGVACSDLGTSGR